ncbi:FUSC family membrane protein [Trinickia sp. Y13]|uniref:FUSC family protein n=1 Tax=Trinickia sp. Y13 TaxID=2917807 RepID=UPI00240716B8|nr:FUSC family membrane protein [Trinickia sp. Y13]MDG0022706.1 FUSC family protein [Trinickia sp. Y13]
MRYSKEIEKFLYGQYFFGGLRMAVGVSLPAVLCLVVFHQADLGFTIATGALGACVVDMPGPLKYKHNEMLICSVLGFASALATGLATFDVFALWATVVALTFALSLTVVYGNRWPQISFATLFMMVMTLEQHFTPLRALTNAAWILAGGLWYTYWATFVSQWQAHRIEKQALAENVFACVDYLLARAAFYDVDANLDDCYRNLVDKQTTAVEMQDAARAIVLRNLPKLRRGQLDASRVTLFNLFINTVDLHELFVGAHTDYPLMRATFGNADVMLFFRDLIRKAASDLEEVGLAVLQNRRPAARVNMKAEMRAIEYEIELMRKQGLPERQPEAYAAASATFRRIWSGVRLIDKMKKHLASDTPGARTELRIDHTLMRFLSNRRVPLRQIFSNLTMASPSFRHALRVTLAVAVGFWLGRLLPLTNAYWIVMTTLIIMKPGYSLTKQRNTQRIVGTTIGCAASIALIWFVKAPAVLLVFMFASMVMSYSLLLFNYTASVVFTSSYVLLLFHLLAPGSMRIIGERAIDTVIGCALAIGASRLFPYWEYRLMGKLVTEMLGATRQYLESAWWRGNAPEAAAGPLPGAAAAAAATVSAVAGGSSRDAAASDERDFRYRLARKNVHIAFANLAQAFRRMMLEPKAHQRFVPELNDLLVQSHGLAAHITAAAPLLRSVAQHESDGALALQRALSAVRENLTRAQAGEAPPADQAETAKLIKRDLDTMVVEIERAGTHTPEFVGELKLLALQCKQMLAASQLIRKDAGAIRLPQP